MAQLGQVVQMKSKTAGGEPRWGYRYRVGGRGSRRVQRGGFQSERDAGEALERALERLRLANGTASTLTLATLVKEYLAQHDAQPETVEKLRWLLAKAGAEFGDRRLGDLRSQEIAAWRMTIAAGHRFEATQALRQVLARAVAWGMIDVNPAKQGVDNPQRRRTEKRPFESWAQLAAVASKLNECSGALVLFAAATGLRPGEWIALERRDIDPVARVVYVRRAYRNGPTEVHQDRRQRPRRAVAGGRARGARAAARPCGYGAALPVPSRRLLRPAQLPHARVEARPTRRRDHTGPTRLRSAAHLRHLRAPCRHLNLRSLPLHGRQPDHDRPPLRPSRPRRTRPRDQPPGQLQPAGRSRRPPGGRRVDTSAARRRHPSQQKKALAGERQKPSDGLEPETPPYQRTSDWRAG